MKVLDNGSSHDTNDRDAAIIEALDQKRRQLDLEIQEFRENKEREFRAFESELRQMQGMPSVESAETAVQHLRWRIKKPKTGIGGEVKTGKEKGRGKGLLKTVERDFARRRKPALAGDNTLPNGSPASGACERDQEFRGLFTPNYLSLLNKESDILRSSHAKENSALQEDEQDGKKNPQEMAKRRRGSLLIEEAEREQMKNEIAAARRSAAPMLSSSAEYHPPAMTSPPPTPARPLSSSVPPEHALNQRRSSSRSDLSIDGLRSSLKNPSQPKSPKRVLFSIDNTVVSPSTSPIAQRGDTGTKTKQKTSSNGSKVTESFEILQSQRDGKTTSNGPSMNGVGGNSFSRFQASSSGRLNGSNPLISSFNNLFHSSASDIDTPPSSATGGEDFDILDNDEEVFYFDEDVSLKNERQEKEDIVDDVPENEETDTDMDSEPALTSSSPHAGSLPIEIRFHKKRDPRS